MNDGGANVPTGWRRLLSHVSASTLATFVVPDARMARDSGLDLVAAGLHVAATPRHASLLLVIGELPPLLAEAATVVYAQMPRPRTILVLGANAPVSLPAAVTAPLDQAGLDRGVAQTLELIATDARSSAEDSFTAPVLQRESAHDDGGTGHAHHMQGSVHGEHDMNHAHHEGHGMRDRDRDDYQTVSSGSPTGHAERDAAALNDPPIHVRGHGPPVGDDAAGDHAAMSHATMGGMEKADRDEQDEGGIEPHAPMSSHGGPVRHSEHSATQHEQGAAVEIRDHASHSPQGDVVPPNPEVIHHHESPSMTAESDHADMDHVAMGHEVMELGGSDEQREMSHHAHPQTNHAAMSRAHGDAPISAAMHHGDHTQMEHDAPRHMHDSGPGRGGSAEMDHAGMDHGMMGRGDHMTDGGFMSMVAMTQNLPRSRDGLPMEWIEIPFGPLFPGLPAGLMTSLTLDGDTVATVSVVSGVTHRDIASSLSGPVGSFPDRLAALDPLAPVAYRVLAWRALDAASGTPAPELVRSSWIGAVERERVISHLGWLTTFGGLIGASWLSTRAGELQLALVRAPDIASVVKIGPQVHRFLRAAGRIPLLRRRLAGIGVLRSTIQLAMYGPVARASGIAVDARMGDAAYEARRFHPIVLDTGDALARLQIRLGEIRQSLDLTMESDSLSVGEVPPSPHLTGSGMASIETPRGAATLHLKLHHGHVQHVHLEVPSAAHLALLPAMTSQAELADALVSIASLDLSPWEVDQ